MLTCNEEGDRIKIRNIIVCKEEYENRNEINFNVSSENQQHRKMLEEREVSRDLYENYFRNLVDSNFILNPNGFYLC